MSPTRKTRSSGFSLIELLIGIALVAITLMLAMPSFRTWIQNTHIRNAAESTVNGMQRARAEAVVRNTNVSFSFGGGSFWTIRQVSDNSVIESRPAEEILDSITRTTLPPAVPPAAPTATITFSNLGTVVANADGTASITQVDFDSTALPAADSRDLRVTIGVSGVARMCDPTVSDPTDLRYCI
ncbi:MAG: GspH/FimT family pseudopilin [Propionivibrio sp.]|nr:GspH/FimT family pseudopilin [Propionivibrio sp.]